MSSQFLSLLSTRRWFLCGGIIHLPCYPSWGRWWQISESDTVQQFGCSQSSRRQHRVRKAIAWNSRARENGLEVSGSWLSYAERNVNGFTAAVAEVVARDHVLVLIIHLWWQKEARILLREQQSWAMAVQSSNGLSCFPEVSGFTSGVRAKS